MKRLTLQRDYKSDFAVYQDGETIEVEDDVAAWLMRDSKGTFVEAGPGPKQPDPEPAVRAIEEPPKDRMVKKPATRRRSSSK